MQRGKEAFRLTPVLFWGGGTSPWGVMSYTYVAERRFVDCLSNSTPLSITPSSFSIPEAQRKLTTPDSRDKTCDLAGGGCIQSLRPLQIPMRGLSQSNRSGFGECGCHAVMKIFSFSCQRIRTLKTPGPISTQPGIRSRH